MVELIRLETYNDPLGHGSLEDGVPGVRTEELGNEQLRRVSSGDRVYDVQYGAVGQPTMRSECYASIRRASIKKNGTI